jgi:signal transduction histidine kinase
MTTGPSLRILLVEDSASDAELLREHLGETPFERFELTHVERLQDALVLLRRSQFDVVLLDLTLPDSVGSETFSTVQLEAPLVPVVVLSGTGDERQGIEAVRHGVQDYLIKGQTDARQVARAIRHAIERRRLEEVVRKSEERYRKLADELERLVDERTRALAERTAELRTLAAELTQAEERERRRLAQAIHDHLQQLLVGAKLCAENLSAGSSAESAQDSVARLTALLREAIKTTRSLTFELSPPILYEAGLVGALEWLAQWCKERHGLSVSLELEEAAEPGREDIKVLLFQAARELLFNVVKHSGVRFATLRAGRVDSNRLRIDVEDEGAGFDRDRIGRPGAVAEVGFGLFSIRGRLGLIGGQLEMESVPGRGSRFTLFAPLE